MYDLTTEIFSKTHNLEIQEMTLWLLNILVKENTIRDKAKPYLLMIDTKKWGWMCLPDLQHLPK